MENNLAFVDGQNLYMGTAKREIEPWVVNLRRFRIYLEQKYKISRAYYHLGYTNGGHEDLYEKIQKAGFILVFKSIMN